ncbi:hypothetical protein M413DRAFT_21942 [Hebeloma cylindrosporum]|uniref:DUF6534 domain-containing protein n=1 Tax=Hebeloma cylindrosporum TaxID=76867 RepID=A0A0C3D052_HEBCY|nr:hypothetical protein M413DRAFT_21942 [Hebeloma cylindrosporum h7]
MDQEARPFLAPQEINKMSGPQVLTVLLNSGLLGILSVQVYLFHLAFPKDRVYMKCLVYGIYFTELVQSILVVETGFRTFVTGFGKVEVFNEIETLWLSVPIFTAIDTFFVQGYYAHRIRILAQSRKVAAAIIALSFIQLGGGIAVGVIAEQEKFYTSLNTPKMLVLAGTSTGIWNVGSVLCDIIIAVCMTYYLSRYDTTIKETKVILKKVIRLTIETGTLTGAKTLFQSLVHVRLNLMILAAAIVGIVSFSLAILPGSPYYYQVPMGIIGKVYANSMLVLINSRMLLTSEETPLTITSALKFCTSPPNDIAEIFG